MPLFVFVFVISWKTPQTSCTNDFNQMTRKEFKELNLIFGEQIDTMDCFHRAIDWIAKLVTGCVEFASKTELFWRKATTISGKKSLARQNWMSYYYALMHHRKCRFEKNTSIYVKILTFNNLHPHSELFVLINWFIKILVAKILFGPATRKTRSKAQII